MMNETGALSKALHRNDVEAVRGGLTALPVDLQSSLAAPPVCVKSPAQDESRHAC